MKNETNYKVEFTRSVFENEIAEHYLKTKISLTSQEWRDMQEEMDIAIKNCMFRALAKKRNDMSQDDDYLFNHRN